MSRRERLFVILTSQQQEKNFVWETDAAGSWVWAGDVDVHLDFLLRARRQHTSSCQSIGCYRPPFFAAGKGRVDHQGGGFCWQSAAGCRPAVVNFDFFC